MEGSRLTETQAKQLADRKARESRSKPKSGVVKFAVVGIIVASLILAFLLTKGTGIKDDNSSDSDSLVPPDGETAGNDDNDKEPILPAVTASPTFSPEIKDTQSPTEEPIPATQPPVDIDTPEPTLATEPPKYTWGVDTPESNLEPEKEESAPPVIVSFNDTIAHENDGSSEIWGLNQHGTNETWEIEPPKEIPPLEEEEEEENYNVYSLTVAPSENGVDGLGEENGNIYSLTGAPSNNDVSGALGLTVSPSDNGFDGLGEENGIVYRQTGSPSDNGVNGLDGLTVAPSNEGEDEVNGNSYSLTVAPSDSNIDGIEELTVSPSDNGVGELGEQNGNIYSLTVAPSDNGIDGLEGEDISTQTVGPSDSTAASVSPSDSVTALLNNATNASDSPSAAPSEYVPKGGTWGFVPETTPAPADGNLQQAATESPSSSPSASPSEASDALSETGENVETEDAAPAEQEGDDEQPQSTTAAYQYRKRGKPISPAKAKELAQEWGEWRLKDWKADQRPTEDYCGAYPKRDIPWAEFPAGAWQTDEDYVGKFLSEGKELVKRAMEVHLSEYGFGRNDFPGDFEQRRDQSPFMQEIVQEGDAEHMRRLSTGVNDRSGWAPQQSYDGLVRRLLHAVVSGSDFNLVLGGHSAAAGHGNYFQQSYALQFQRVMEPVLARLGVKHYSRNTGMGGLGTIQSVMGARDIYGSDVDILIWDSSMTESSGSPDFDLFVRQGILGSDRAPMLWAGIDEKKLLPILQEHADIDFMMYGTGMGPIPITDPTKIDEVPWAAKYLKCDNEFQSLCKDNRYNGTCWIDRPDFVPQTPQNAELGGKASWHDGNRAHQLYGRTMSFTVLTALHEALDFWDKQPQHKLSDDMWHMTDYYKNIQSKIANLDPGVGNCYEVSAKNMSTAWCTTSFQSRTEFTPRANPAETSIRSIMKPFGPDASVPKPELNIYDPPDVYNPILGVPEGEVDYLAVIENGIEYEMFDAPQPLPRPTKTGNRLIELTVDDNGEKIVPGLGWGINTKASPNLCNGTYDSFCGRSADHKCLLYGHNDYRGGLTFDSLSGWGVFTLRDLKEGKIFLKMDSWRKANDNPVTEGWTEENNGQGGRSLQSQGSDDHQIRPGNVRRRAKDANAEFCPDFLLEFAFGDQVVRLKYDEVLGDRHALVQRVVQIWTVLDDPDFTKGETVDIELGVRLRGCERQHVFWLSTIYWA